MEKVLEADVIIKVLLDYVIYEDINRSASKEDPLEKQAEDRTECKIKKSEHTDTQSIYYFEPEFMQYEQEDSLPAVDEEEEERLELERKVQELER